MFYSLNGFEIPTLPCPFCGIPTDVLGVDLKEHMLECAINKARIRVDRAVDEAWERNRGGL